MTQNCAVNSNSRPGARDINHSSCSSTAASRQRFSCRSRGSADRRASSVEVACDLSLPATGAATSALLNVLSPSPPENPSKNESVMCISLTSSAAAESSAEVWTDRVEGKSCAPLLTEERSATFAVCSVNSDGVSPAARSGVVLDATEHANISSCSAEVLSPRTHHAAAGVTTASGSPDAFTPSSTASASPTRKHCSSAGVMSAAEEDAPAASSAHTADTYAMPQQLTSFVVSATCAEKPTSSREARSPPTRATVAEDTHNASNTFRGPRISEGSECMDSAPHQDKQKSEVATCGASPEERHLAETSQHVITARLADDHPSTHTTRLRPYLPPEAVDTATNANEADNAPVARGVKSGAASPAAVAVFRSSATSVVETEAKNEGGAGRAGGKSGQLHDRQNGTDCHNQSGNSKSERSEEDALAATHATTPSKGETLSYSQQAQTETDFQSVQLNEIGEADSAHSSVHESSANTTGSTQSGSASSESAISADTKKSKTSLVEERAGRLSDKLRAKFKREFNRSWVDINSAPSWPPIKKTKYLTSDWKIVDLRVGATQRQEKKKNRLFLNSLCYLFDGVYTQKSTLGRKAGLGLFCERPEGFRKGQIITEFVGWLVDREQAESYRKQRAASHIVAVQKGFLYIDGAKEPTYGMGGGSFANDGSEFLGGPGNNAHFYHWFDDELGRTRVFIRATADIRSGQEIFVPYERTYWVDNFEEQAENCPEPFRKKKLEQLRKKIRHVEELHKSRLANRQKASSSAAGTRRVAASTSSKQKAVQQQDSCQLPGKNNKVRINLKRPLSAYMLFSKERRRELLLQHYRPAEQQLHPQVSPAAPGPDRGIESVLRSKEKQTVALQPVTTQHKRRMKGADAPPAPEVEVQRHETCGGAATSPRKSERGQEGRKRLRSPKSIDISAAESAGGVDGCEPSGMPHAAVQPRERSRIRKEGTDTSVVHYHDSAAGPVPASTAVAATGDFASSVGVRQEETGVQTRRRSSRLSQCPALSCVEDAAAEETPRVSAEAERAAAAAATGVTRTGSGELVSGKTKDTLTEGVTVANCGEDGTGKNKKVTGRRTSRRWVQASSRASLPAADAGVLAGKSAPGTNGLQNSETEEESVGGRRGSATRATEVRETNGEAGRHSNRSMRNAVATQGDCETHNSKATPAVLTREGVSETCHLPSADPCSQKRKRSIAEGEDVRTAAGKGCAYAASAVCNEPAAGLKADATLEYKTRSHKNIKVEEEPGAAKSAGGAGGPPDANAGTGDRKSAVLQHFASVIRRVAGEWSAMPAQERRRWERLAAKQRERYMLLRQKYSPKKLRRNTKQVSRCSMKVPHKTKKASQPQRKKGVKRVVTADTPAPGKAGQSRMVRGKALTANSDVAAAVGTSAGSTVAPGAAVAEREETQRCTRARTPYRSAVSIRMGQLTSKVDTDSVGGNEGDAEQTEASEEAKRRAPRRKRCALRAATTATEGVTEETGFAVSDRYFLRNEQACVTHVQEEQRMRPQKPCDGRQTGEDERHWDAMQAQRPKRSRRHVGTAEAAATWKKATRDSVSQQKQQLSISRWSYTSSMSSCSTTRTSSSRNSSRGSRTHTHPDTSRTWQAPVKGKNLPTCTSERAEASVQIGGVTGMLDGQQHAVGAELQGSTRSPQHQREQKKSQEKMKLQNLPATRQQQQHFKR